ncbi:MAG TPA: cation-translocating P-type ATPase C-terminal domain-containing protein [Patescibacteria group bacterium]|nr:cation-translocating P-type ATPase C-terminal domain-containing protein [Patescibacteria group bacterium]
MDTPELLALLSIASLPLGLRLIARYLPRLRPVSAAYAIMGYNVRVTLLAEVFLVLAGIVARAVWHIPWALTALQLLLANLLLLLPIRTLFWEPKPHYTKEPNLNLFWFGLLAAGLAYANFVFCFVRNNLDLGYVSTRNPLYFKATSTALLTLVLCQSLNLLLSRSAHHAQFFTRHLWSNRQLLRGFGAITIVLTLILYMPGVNNFFGTGPLDATDWFWVVIAGGIYLGCRVLQRHTRKHSRHAVLQLHRQVSSSKTSS